jgi:hypothetical protein
MESFMTCVDPRGAHGITPIISSPRKWDNFRDTTLEFQSDVQKVISPAFFVAFYFSQQGIRSHRHFHVTLRAWNRNSGLC